MFVTYTHFRVKQYFFQLYDIHDKNLQKITLNA